MNSSAASKFRKELNGGLVGLVLLALLAETDAAADLYGYEIAKRLAQGSAPAFKAATIYPVLRGLSAAGLLTSRIVPSYSGPPRRYYRITSQGRATLAEWRAIWSDTRDFVNRFTGAEG